METIILSPDVPIINAPNEPKCFDKFSKEEEEEEEEIISMLNIRMSRAPIEGSPVPGCFTPWRAHILVWSRFVPGTTKCLHPNRGHRSYQGLPSGTGVRCEGGSV